MATKFQPRKSSVLPTPLELLWAAIGVLITVAGTLQHVSLPSVLPFDFAAGEWSWDQWSAGYTFSLQLGGVLLTACLGGGRAACLAQIGYVALGLAGYEVFSLGGGPDYIQLPSFGYLLGFVPGAWLCGSLVQANPQPTLSWLTTACLAGLGAIHLTGITYLMTQAGEDHALGQLLWQYSGYPLLGQLLVTVGVVGLAAIARRLMLY